MTEDFLSRWSRRKEKARRVELSPEPRSDETAGLTPAAPPQHDPETLAAERALTPEEIAALPKIHELAADSDFAVFLRRGVPDALRNAALRKMWMLDPAIRDFAGHARDYAYDWNTPGGVPGHGALEPGDDVPAMVRSIFGEPDAATSGQATDETARDRVVAVRSVDGIPAAGTKQKIAREEQDSAVDRETES